ncbi:MAG: hypothetical protein ACHQ03_08665 [Candidatus Bathyarchaeia archaeon]
MSFQEDVCPWCHGVGGQWEVVVTKSDEIKLFENCRGCHGLGKVLRSRD